MWEFLVAFVLGALTALVLAWVFYVAKLKQEMLHTEGMWKEFATRVKRFQHAVEAVHSIAFGPYGVAPQMIEDAFNQLWKLAGLPEKGKP